MGTSRDNTIPSGFWGLVLGYVCVCICVCMHVCDLCRLGKNIYLSKFTCEMTSGPRFAREPVDLLWVFCDLCVEKEMLPAAFTGSL